jgi:CubicO group peptidase (beta-lactamase class C family)
MPRTSLRRIAAALLPLVTGASTLGAQPDAAAVDRIFARYATPGAPGASVLVMRHGTVLLERTYGLSSLEHGTPVEPGSAFRLASLTKQFTAATVLLLAREGRLRLDEPVVDVLPELPAHARGVTIRHLLTHTSGLWDYESFVPDTQTVQVKDRDVPRLLQQARGPYFPPGTRYRYSNTGYALLALVVERRGGAPFARLLHERIFAPLGMTGAVAFEDGVSTVARRAWGYAPAREGGWRPRDQSNTSAVLGDGGVYASVRDLARWYAALDSATLLRLDELRAVTTPAALADGTPGPYGFGWFVDQDGARPRLSHHGETSGFTNAVLRYPVEGITVLVLTNRAGGAPWDLALAVADLMLDRPTAGATRSWPFEPES